MIPIDVYSWSPSLVSVAGVLGSKLTRIRDVPVVVRALWWCEYVIVCGIPLVIQSKWVLIILDSLLLLWACVIFGFLHDLLFYFAVVGLRQ